MTRGLFLGVGVDFGRIARYIADGADRETAYSIARGGSVFRGEPYREVARRLGLLSADAHLQADSSTVSGWLSCTEFGAIWDRDPGTVRRWVTSGRIPGARKVGSTWMIPADAEPPADRRTKRT